MRCGTVRHLSLLIGLPMKKGTSAWGSTKPRRVRLGRARPDRVINRIHLFFLIRLLNNVSKAALTITWGSFRVRPRSGEASSFSYSSILFSYSPLKHYFRLFFPVQFLDEGGADGEIGRDKFGRDRVRRETRSAETYIQYLPNNFPLGEQP